MRRWVLALMFLISIVPAVGQAQAPALDVREGDRAAIRAVIGDQIAAFRRDDAAAAYAFASPSIQRQFAAPDIFLEMVRRGYAPVYRPQSVTFGDLVRVDTTLIQLVEIVGPDGVSVLAAYEMEQQSDGAWRINGCALLAIDRRQT